jgi:hypothetical protein
MVNVAALVTVGKDDLDELIGQVPDYLTQDVDRGLRQVRERDRCTWSGSTARFGSRESVELTMLG